MKKTCIIATAVIGLALAAPVSAHHNCMAAACPEEIGDMMGNHEAAIEALGEMGGDARMDASDPADNMADTATQTGGGADLPELSRPNIPGTPDPDNPDDDYPGGTQKRPWVEP